MWPYINQNKAYSIQILSACGYVVNHNMVINELPSTGSKYKVTSEVDFVIAVAYLGSTCAQKHFRYLGDNYMLRNMKVDLGCSVEEISNMCLLSNEPSKEIIPCPKEIIVLY